VTRQHIGNTTYEVFNKYADADRRFTDLLEEIMARDFERQPFPAEKILSRPAILLDIIGVL